MEFEDIPTVPTADEILDRSFRRAAAKMREKKNKDRANEEFVRAVSHSIHDRLFHVVQSFPNFDHLPLFYRDIADILYGIDRLRKSLGAVGWAADWARKNGSMLARETRYAKDTMAMRKKAVARLSSVVHQIDSDLRFLNEVRNVLRKLPHVDDVFSIVIAGYPNVGKSSFIRLVSTAHPEIASYPFTTKGIIVGHRKAGRERMQFIDTPGVLDRPVEERNPIERQAMTAMINLADVVLYILDASERCGYPIDEQLSLLEEIRDLVTVPVIVVVNKADEKRLSGFINMSTTTGEGVDEVLEKIVSARNSDQSTVNA